MSLVVAGMLSVAAIFALLVISDSKSMRATQPGLKRLADLAWLAVTVGGWIVLGYLALATAGGPEAAWEWIGAQSIALRIVMWLLLLPWMSALWIWQTSLAEWLRISLIAGLALLTTGIALSRVVGNSRPAD